jgi:hypothetical protein
MFLSHEIDYQGRNEAPIPPESQLAVIEVFGFLTQQVTTYFSKFKVSFKTYYFYAFVFS